MHTIDELHSWERMMKLMAWEQIGSLKNLKILDFGSGQGITANQYAKDNLVTAIEPSEEMLKNRWQDNAYVQIHGGIEELKAFSNDSFDFIFIHNVLEYIIDKEQILKELTRVLKPNGHISIIKHNRNGRIMQTAVLLDDIQTANDLLNGKNSTASKFGEIRYYEDSDISLWANELEIVKRYGIRTFWDLQQDQKKHSSRTWQDEMISLEKRVSTNKNFYSIAFFHHIILTKKKVIPIQMKINY